MPSQHVERLVDFAAAGEGLHFVSWSSGPFSSIVLLFVKHPMAAEAELPDPDPGLQRIIHLVDGHDRGRVDRIDLQPGFPRIRSANILPDGRIFFWTSRPRLTFDYRLPPPPAGFVLDRTGHIDANFRVGEPWSCQIADDGAIWLAYSDEGIYGGGPPGGQGVVSLNASGEIQFSWYRDAIKSGLVYPISSTAGLNVVSSSEMWVCFSEEGSLKSHGYEWDTGLARLIDGEIDRTWPWTVLSEKAPVCYPGSLAVSGNGVLTQGWTASRFPKRPEPDDDRDRLYWIALDSMRSLELFPVDEHGDWIGSFWTEGRGSLLYMKTKTALYMLDARTLPAFLRQTSQ